MSSLKIDVSGFDNLQKAMREYQGNTESTVNEVLHNEAGQLIHDAVKQLILPSGREWKGKKPPAKTSNSLAILEGNLSVTVATKKNWSYLYFPDDGSNTRRHAGNQQFFHRGGESQTEEIVNRCIKKLVNSFDNAIS